MTRNSRELWLQVMRMQRSDIVSILEGVSIACYDNESTRELATALYENVLDGTVSQDALNAFDERSTT